ncbi:hypothetical protein [Entomomonas asaccharolytica]|uniref:Uncharacterized protein n=1 Tax=Entomomonas asaccharolytica TaxID=2785331 RepID=A0A974NE51_9GAMM|nr:hypothetical protein [Entomomonas asaccharolytica]QQP85136.1 hypothetical protein JHT90_12200 [Entomomonas asaccharolytica]
MKTKKKISFKFYIIFLIVILLLIWGQTKDVTLLPAVKNQLSHISPQTNIAPANNAFVAMAGFNVYNTEDMVDEGFIVILKAIKSSEQTPFEYNMIFQAAKGHELTKLYQLPCDANFSNNQCLQDITEQAAVIRQLMQEQKGFVNNYLALQKFPEFAHILPANLNSTVPYQYISSVAQLLMANAILEVNAGNIDEGLSFLINDIKFYRHMLNSKQRNKEDTVIFINRLNQHYFVLDRLLHSGINLAPYLPELMPLLKPLTPQERNLVWTLENERNYQIAVQISLGHMYFYTGYNEISGCYNDSCAFDRYFSRLLYKFNGTLNAVYLDWQPTIDFAKVDYPLNDNFLEKLKSLREIEKNHHTFNVYRLYERYGFFFLKNYVGEKHKNTIYYEEGYTNIETLSDVCYSLNLAAAVRA